MSLKLFNDMIAKKYLCLILTLWLINTVTYLHGASSFANVTDHLQYPGETCQEGDTALAYVSQVFSSDENGGDANHNPTKRFPRKILVQVITAQRNVLDAELELENTRKNIFINAINLYCAVGGGWR